MRCTVGSNFHKLLSFSIRPQIQTTRKFFSMTSEAPIVIPASTPKPDGAIIFLHGLGDTGHGWSAGFQSIKQSNLKYIFPTAPTSPVTLNFGMPMPSWFDIFGLSHTDKEDEQGIKFAADNLVKLVEAEEKAGIPSNRVIIGGFSQGGAVALYAAVSASKPLAGVIALSSWLPLHKQIGSIDTKNKDACFFQGHGDADPMVNLSFGKMSSQLLKSKGHEKYTFKEYNGMMHGSCDKEMTDVKNFIRSTLPSLS